MENLKSDNRNHTLDAIRAFSMLLGIFLHSSLSFLNFSLPSWSIQDSSRGLWADVLLFAIHSFRMQLFFMLSGYFSCLMISRSSAKDFISNRIQRILFPLIFGVFLINPLTAYLLGEKIYKISLMHLWFLYFLLIFNGASCALSGFLKKLHLPAIFLKLWVLIPLTTLLLIPMESWSLDSSFDWVPAPRLLIFYFCFYLLGWWIFQDNLSIFEAWTKRWKTKLIVANLIALPLTVGLSLWLLPLKLTEPSSLPPGHEIYHLLILLSYATYGWLMIHALVGAFSKYFSKMHPWVSYLSRSSYWMYLMSLIPIAFFQSQLSPVQLPGVLKFMLVFILSFLTLLASYHFLVKDKFIGRILNGDKKKGA